MRVGIDRRLNPRCCAATTGRSMVPRGFSMIELILVLTVAGIVLGIAAPKMRVSPTRKVRMTAIQLQRDLELTRTRALSTKKMARVAFDTNKKSYQGFLDHDRNGEIGEQKRESEALHAFGRRDLPKDVDFGVGTAGRIPEDSTGAGAITFEDELVEFGARGVTVPFGQRGVIYLVHRDDPDAVAAVGISGSASFKIWAYRDGAWR